MEWKDPRALKRMVPQPMRWMMALSPALAVRALRVGFAELIPDLEYLYSVTNPFRRHHVSSAAPSISGTVGRYCKGIGLEVGPGDAPSSNPARTTYVDKFPEAYESRIQVEKVSDAGELPFTDESFDYVVASHVLEHLPNPIRALQEWLRVLKQGGALVLVLPHPARCFDKGRGLTTLNHLIEDFEKSVTEDDPDHNYFDWDAQTWTSITKAGRFHYHVWTQTEICDLISDLRCEIALVSEEVSDRFDSFVVVARRRSEQHGRGL